MLGRLKYLLVPMVVLVLGAGMVIGRISTRLQATTQPADKAHGWFDEQLNLSADQRKQMDAIWGDVRQNVGKTFEGRAALDKERDQAILDLLSDDQKKAYNAVLDNYRAKRGEMDKQRDKLFADANAKSRAILTEEQQKRWDALSKDHHGWPGAGQRRGRPGSQPTSRPGSRPSMPMGGPMDGPPPDMDRGPGPERNR